MSIELTDDQYLDLLLRARQPAKKRRPLGCGGLVYGALALAMIAAFAVLTADRLGYVPPSVMGPFVGTPQVVFSTQPTGVGQVQQRQPVAPLPVSAGAPAWPTLTPEPEATQEPTLTIPPVPTATEGFWNATEIAAFTATSEAWYDPSTLPTAEPAFVEYAAKACQDPEQVAESATLRLFCGK